jgi:adenylate cyclase
VDWEKEGLLKGLEGEAREAREELLDQLHGADVDVDELRKAVDEDRLALLPVEIELGGERALTQEDVAKKADVPVDFLLEQRRALGLPQVPEDEKAFGKEDVEAAKQLKDFIDAGLPAEGILAVSRVMGEGMARTVDAVLDIAGQAFLKQGDNERDLGLRYAEAAKQLIPIMEEQLDYVFNLHMREGIRSDVIGATERATGKIPGSKEVVVCFADLVDFTKLGENLPPEEIGGVAGELADMAADVASGDVKLVKTIGDAAMLVSPDDEAMVDAAIELVARADEAREGFPQLRAGVARGDALNRGGDWYGRPVNVASRVTSVARPGSVLVTESVREAAEDAFAFSRAGKRKLKGVKGEVALYRVRRKNGSNGSGDDD